MDTALNTKFNDDISGLGIAYKVSGKNEINRKLYILLSARKGSFIYDRELGSDIFMIDITKPDCIPEIEAKARKALEKIPDAEIVGVSVDDGSVYINIELEGELYEIKLKI